MNETGSMNASQCVDCAVGQYGNGSVSCTPCPAFSLSRERAAAHIANCSCVSGYAGVIVAPGDRCSPLPRASAVSSGVGAPIVSVVWQSDGGRPPNFGDKLVLLGNVSAASQVVLTWAGWMSNSTCSRSMVLDSIAVTSTNVTRPSGAGQVVPLVIPADTFRAPMHTEYFIFRLTASAGSAISYAEMDIFMNDPPQHGRLQSVPRNGTAVSTMFNLSAQMWQDEDLPLTYRFFAIDGGNHIALGPVSSANMMSTVLSAGRSVDSYAVQVGVNVEDTFGGVASTLEEVKVLPYVLDLAVGQIETLSEVAKLLSEANQSRNNIAVLTLVSAVASSIGTGPLEGALAAREMLIDTLQDSTGAEELTPDQVSAALGAVTEIATEPEQMSSSATDKAIRILSSLVKQLQPEDGRPAATAVSNMLGVIKSNLVNSSAAVERSSSLSKILERTTVVLSAELVAGEPPAVVDTPHFRMSAYPRVAVADSGTIGSTLLVLGRAGASVNVTLDAMREHSGALPQMIEWTGEGPHFWAGRNLTEQSDDVIMESSVLTVSFLNSSGDQIEIANLSHAAAIGLEVPEYAATSQVRKQLQRLTTDELRRRAIGFGVSVSSSNQPNDQLIQDFLNVEAVEDVASSSLYCAYWDVDTLRWNVEGRGTFHRVGATFVADCQTTHFTGARLRAIYFSQTTACCAFSIYRFTPRLRLCRFRSVSRPASENESAWKSIGLAVQSNRVHGYAGHAWNSHPNVYFRHPRVSWHLELYRCRTRRRPGAAGSHESVPRGRDALCRNEQKVSRHEPALGIQDVYRTAYAVASWWQLVSQIVVTLMLHLPVQTRLLSFALLRLQQVHSARRSVSAVAATVHFRRSRLGFDDVKHRVF